MPQLLYLPYMALCNFFLFPKTKEILKDHCFGSAYEIKNAVLSKLKATVKIEFQNLSGIGECAGISA